jgi:hypothetical protein
MNDTTEARIRAGVTAIHSHASNVQYAARSGKRPSAATLAVLAEDADHIRRNVRDIARACGIEY